MKKYDYYEDVSFLIGKTDKEAILLLKKPSVFKITGKDNSKAVLVSTLIHGHEICGFRAFLKEINSKPEYPLDVYFAVGNVQAAQIEPLFSNRLVPGGQNFNRTWIKEPKTEMEQLSFELFEFYKTLPLVGILDLHSFTATDTLPHGFLPDTKEETLKLANKLANYGFVTDSNLGAMIELTTDIAPSLVIECGTNGSKEADEYAFETLHKFFKLTGVEEGNVEDVNKGVFVNMTNVKIKSAVTVVWADEKQDAQLTIRSDISKLNITEVKAGEFYGWANTLDLFVIKNKDGLQNVEDWFELKDGKVYIKQDVVPNLMSANEKIAKESGFYFFKRWEK
ncbi:hypothetical protein COV18_01320 [Candidatus Woesearchaeota archaeon CG10_big_fil_rev_8_21_14_0_10_37_12]|nr:MAG: hypothetical protein COV18_01320 [Candidatus Woesearchaeota archaeon CG10_big_fil_rev_8_21_14_0_10_37_12]